jgi:hypothetical protein
LRQTIGPPGCTRRARGHGAESCIPVTAKVVALTCDAGADLCQADSLRSYLTGVGVKATFSRTGRRAESSPELVRAIADDGQERMNDTYDHRPKTGVFVRPAVLSPTDGLAEVGRTDAIVRPLTGIDAMPLSRPLWSIPAKEGSDVWHPEATAPIRWRMTLARSSGAVTPSAGAPKR